MIKPGATLPKNLFIDPDFKPIKPSLYSVNPQLIASGEESGTAPAGEEVAWYRTSEIFKDGKIDVFEGKIEPGDILQGALGDCWFLCAIACLAEFPTLVEDLFPADSKKFNPSGKYNVRLCEAGSWETITIDDFIPCYPEGTTLRCTLSYRLHHTHIPLQHIPSTHSFPLPLSHPRRSHFRWPYVCLGTR